jgi:hypothetical protein
MKLDLQQTPQVLISNFSLSEWNGYRRVILFDHLDETGVLVSEQLFNSTGSIVLTVFSLMSNSIKVPEILLFTYQYQTPYDEILVTDRDFALTASICGRMLYVLVNRTIITVNMHSLAVQHIPTTFIKTNAEFFSFVCHDEYSSILYVATGK